MCKVSVIMPLFNANKYIYKTIHSILNQTYPDFELIIIDDKSLDNSVDIVNSIKDKRIKLYMNEKNMGIAYTRNRALDLCNGEYIAIMDDDDIAPDYRFKDEVEFLNGNKEIDIVAGNTCFIDENDKVTGMGERVIRNSRINKSISNARKCFLEIVQQWLEKILYENIISITRIICMVLKIIGFGLSVQYMVKFQLWIKLCCIGENITMKVIK